RTMSFRPGGKTMTRLDLFVAALALGTLTWSPPSSFAQTAPSPVIVAPALVAQPAQAPATHANRQYLKIDGVQGESAEPAHLGWMEVQSFQWSVQRSGGATARVAARQAQATPSSLSVTKFQDKTSPVLQSVAAEGKHFKTAVLDFISRIKGEYYQITLTDVL